MTWPTLLNPHQRCACTVAARARLARSVPATLTVEG